MWRRVYSFFLCSFLFFLPSFAYTIKYTTSPDSFPGPGANINFTVLKDDGDISPIDVVLVNTAGDGSVTTVIDSLSPNRDNNLVVAVPKDATPGQYLLRFVDHSTKKFILDSATFQIYAAGTTSSSASSSSSTSSPVTTSTSTGSSTSSHSKKTNIGPIVGGVVGGVAVIALIAVLLLCLRKRRHRAAGKQDIGNEKTLSTSSTSTQAAKIEPFTIASHPRLPPDDSSNGNDTSSAFSSNVGLRSTTATGAVSSGKGGYLGHVYRPSTNTVDTSSASVAPSSDLNSRLSPSDHLSSAASPSTAGSTRDFITTSGPSFSSPAESSRENELSAQLMRLQEQVRQIEARQVLGSGSGGEDFSIPPPVYDGPPAPVAAISSSHQISDSDSGARPLPSISSGDVKVSPS